MLLSYVAVLIYQLTLANRCVASSLKLITPQGIILFPGNSVLHVLDNYDAFEQRKSQIEARFGTNGDHPEYIVALKIIVCIQNKLCHKYV